jgi:hypothetical protein
VILTGLDFVHDKVLFRAAIARARVANVGAFAAPFFFAA